MQPLFVFLVAIRINLNLFSDFVRLGKANLTIDVNGVLSLVVRWPDIDTLTNKIVLDVN